MPENYLDTVDIVKMGRELQVARKRAKKTQEEAAKLIGVSRTTITAIEKGERRIKETELIQLSKAYGRPVSDFVKRRTLGETLNVKMAQFRGPYMQTPDDLDSIEPYIQTLADLCQDYLELEEITSSPLRYKYPDEYRIGALSIDQAAEVIAHEERNRLGLGDGPLPTLRDVLEQDVGLRIFYIPLQPSKFSAIYLFADQVGGCIAVNSLHPEERRRWSMAHDYGHFLASRYQSRVTLGEAFDNYGYQRVPESEQFADAFAGYFLMPTSGLRKRFGDLLQREQRLTVGSLITLAYLYGVSPQALTGRLEALKILPTATWDKLSRDRIKIREIQEQLGLGILAGNADTFPLRYQQLAIDAFYHGWITEGHLTHLLGRNRLEVRTMVDAKLIDTQDMLISSLSDRPQGRYPLASAQTLREPDTY